MHVGCLINMGSWDGLQCEKVAVLGIFFETMNPYEDNPFLNEVFGAFETRDLPESQDKVSINIDAFMKELVTDAFWSY